MVDAADHHRPGPGVTLVNTSDRHGHRANGSGGQSGRQTEGNSFLFLLLLLLLLLLLNF